MKKILLGLLLFISVSCNAACRHFGIEIIDSLGVTNFVSSSYGKGYGNITVNAWYALDQANGGIKDYFKLPKSIEPPYWMIWFEGNESTCMYNMLFDLCVKLDEFVPCEYVEYIEREQHGFRKGYACIYIPFYSCKSVRII